MKSNLITAILAAVIFNFSGHALSGQERIVHGTVTTFEAITLTNASIKVKSTKKTVYSDTLGGIDDGSSHERTKRLAVVGAGRRSGRSGGLLRRDISHSAWWWLVRRWCLRRNHHQQWWVRPSNVHF